LTRSFLSAPIRSFRCRSWRFLDNAMVKTRNRVSSVAATSLSDIVCGFHVAAVASRRRRIPICLRFLRHLEINPELSAPGLPQTAVAILVILPQKAQTRHTNPWGCLIKTGGWMVFNHEGIGFRTFV